MGVVACGPIWEGEPERGGGDRSKTRSGKRGLVMQGLEKTLWFALLAWAQEPCGLNNARLRLALIHTSWPRAYKHHEGVGEKPLRPSPGEASEGL